MPISTHEESPSSPRVETYEYNKNSAPGYLERFLPLLIFVFCFAYLTVFRHYTTLEPDEGIVLQGAERIMAGQIPYRDFFSFYTPGSYYLLAGLFRIFGDSFAVARISLAAVGAICSVVTYVLARRVCSPGIAVFAAVLATTAGAAFRFLVLHNPYSTLGCCLCLYAALRLLETHKASWSFAVGSLASITFLIEQSKGAGLVLGLALGIVTLRVVNRTFPLRKSALIASAIGVFWPMAITFGYFGAHHATNLMVQSWLWPLQHYTQANHVPYGYQNWSDQSRDAIFHQGPFWVRVIKIFIVLPNLLLPVLPLIAIGLLGYWIVRIRGGSCSSSEGTYYVTMCSVLSGLLVSVVIVRADILHFMYLAPLWYVVLAWILGARVVRSELLIAVRVPLVAFTAASFGLLSMAVLFAATGARNHVQTRRGVIATGGTETGIDYIQSRVAPKGQLMIYPYLPLYNYLTDTRSPIRFDYFQPGMNTPEQAQEIISSLVASKAPVLFEPAFAEKIVNSWPGTSIQAVANDTVADFIARNYRICQTLRSPEGWRFQFMVKKEMPCL
jgi:4-amino-4-deoxy-L-arabinose transferase-like glycosyltransferase